MPIPQRAADALYAVVSPECVQKLDLPGIDGSGWWASRNWRKKLTKFDAKTGELWWAVGRRASAVAEPGQMYHPMSVSGISGDLIFVPDTLGPLWVWHRDGLFLGHLFKDHQGQASRTSPSTRSPMVKLIIFRFHPPPDRPGLSCRLRQRDAGSCVDSARRAALGEPAHHPHTPAGQVREALGPRRPRADGKAELHRRPGTGRRRRWQLQGQSQRGPRWPRGMGPSSTRHARRPAPRRIPRAV